MNPDLECPEYEEIFGKDHPDEDCPEEMLTMREDDDE